MKAICTKLVLDMTRSLHKIARGATDIYLVCMWNPSPHQYMEKSPQEPPVLKSVQRSYTDKRIVIMVKH